MFQCHQYTSYHESKFIVQSSPGSYRFQIICRANNITRLSRLVQMLIFLSPDKAQATELPKFREQILSAHNFKRQIHKVPLLAEDNQLDTEAQGFAMKLANQGNITHSSLQDRLGQGENIAVRCALKGMILVCACLHIGKWIFPQFSGWLG